MTKGNRSKRFTLTGYTSGLVKLDGFISELAFSNPAKFYSAQASDQLDLNFIVGVLTEEGGNSNFAYFKQSLMLKHHISARLKPVNIGHEKAEIIGVMYDSAIADSSNRIIEPDEIGFREDGTPYYKGEGKIRILVAAALYNKIGRDEVDRIVESVKAGERVDLSMECWYKSWDYLLVGSNSKEEFVSGKDESSKYLDGYVGKEFNGKRVFRVFDEEGFIFGGIGKVEKGACPASVILAAASLNCDENVEGESTFNEEVLIKLHKKIENKNLALASKGAEGVHEMKKVKLDANGKPVLDSAGKEVYEEVAVTEVVAELVTAPGNMIDVNSIVTSIQTQATQIAEKDVEIKSLQTGLAVAQERIAELEKSSASTESEYKSKLDTVTAQANASALEAQGLKYVVRFINECANTSCEIDDIKSKFSVDGFNDEAYEKYVSDLKKAQEEQKLAAEKAEKAALCALFKLDPEKATDEQIVEARAKVEATLKVNDEVPPTPTKPAEKTNLASAAAVASSKGVEGKTTIKVVCPDTGKEETITV